MDELTEAHRRTPSTFHHAGAQSPRVGGCVGSFFHMLDWKHSKRFSSTKRITAERPNQGAQYVREDQSTSERTYARTLKPPSIASGKEKSIATLQILPTFNSTRSPSSDQSVDTSKRVPGVVARLMGLEELPDKTFFSGKFVSSDFNNDVTDMTAHEQLHSPPVLLQELLRQEFRQCSKQSFKDKLPGFTKRLGESKPTRGVVPQRKRSTGRFREHLHQNGDSRAARSARLNERKASFTQYDVSTPFMKQPFQARMQESSFTPQHTNSQTGSTPLLSPSMLSEKNTIRLLESAVKALETSMHPSPKNRFALVREAHRDAQCDIDGSFRSDKRSFTSSYSNSSSRSFRSPSVRTTWSGGDDRAEHSGHESSSPASWNFSTRSASSRQDRSSRKRFQTTLVASSRSGSPLQTHRSRSSDLVKMEASPPPPQAVLGTHEASIRGFKTDLGNQSAIHHKKKLGKQEHYSKSAVLDSPPVNIPPMLPGYVGTHIEVGSPQPCTHDQNSESKAAISQGLLRSSATVTEKLITNRHFRPIRFRGRGEKQAKEAGGQARRVFPSEKDSEHQSVELPFAKESTVAGAGSSNAMFFSRRKQGDKKVGKDKSESIALKRKDGTLMRSLLRRPSGMIGTTPVPTNEPDSQNVLKTSKSSKKVNVEVNVVNVESVKGAANQDSFLVKLVSKEPLSPLSKVLEKPNAASLVQGRYKCVDDVFPELPLEEIDEGGASPDLRKTIQAVEEQFMEFRSHGETTPLDCRSIERMFGKKNSRTCVHESPTRSDSSPLENLAPETSPTSPEVYITGCRSIPGTFPNSPLVKYEKSYFSSWNRLNLQDMLEAASGDNTTDPTGQRRSFCSAELRELVLDVKEAGVELDICNSDICDNSCSPERVEIQTMSVAAGWSEVVTTPPALKKFEEQLAQGFSDSNDGHTSAAEESEQPSPVSVLVSPFLDEVSTMPDAISAESEQTDKDLIDIGNKAPSPPSSDDDLTDQAKENLLVSKVSMVTIPETIYTDHIKQDTFYVSSFRNVELSSVEFKPPITHVGPQQEQAYIREVLDAANLLIEEETPLSLANPPMNISLFDRLNKRDLMEFKQWLTPPDAPRQDLSERSERKLLFDCVNEVMALEPWMKTSSFYVDLPMFPDMCSNSKFQMPLSGESLVKEVHRMICHWREIAGNVLDDLIDYDMNVPEGRWVVFSHEVAEVGLDIERMLLKKMIGEIVDEMGSISTARV
uniref:DUF4378 domain-containing protein n=2 Tax=Physcomitrium patens TaxID=3218 RepID=A0A2K1IV76_PHYPA|nr:uncharacterized protein LOC112273023 isoform X1 [Physcomitrium patens]PNR33183.1 hypothetical protein PHYPA_025126 [Physcomitrium patens]|eukprot:XP_024357103.1 uncharacterized protein LOC112273023 isoform X1 [Physcomitrella patens]